MVLGIGCDLLEISRLSRLKEGSGYTRIFTEEERRQADGRLAMLAGDFAVKEAVSKCFGTGMRGFSFQDIEVLRDALGKPFVRLHGGAAALFQSMRGSGIFVSITDTRDLAIATAVLEGGGKAQAEQGQREEAGQGVAVSEDAEAFLRLLPRRRPDANKGTYGKVLLLAGSAGMGGAAFLSALAAYRSGAGLLRILTARENLAMLQSLIPEAIVECYGQEDLRQGGLEKIAERGLAWADVFVIGPGLSTGEVQKEMLRVFLDALSARHGSSPLALGKHTGKGQGQCPILLLDADGLNLLPILSAEGKGGMLLLDKIAKALPVILTPHPMEMSRISGKSLDEILRDPGKVAAEFSRQHHVITVMKGSCTQVFPGYRDAAGHFQNLAPSPALSKAGSGDVLAGCIAGIIEILKAGGSADSPGAQPGYGNAERRGQGERDALLPWELAYNAAVLGVLAHAEAGRRAARIYGEHGVLARDTANELGRVLKDWTEWPDGSPA